jgi:hypothetical protein
LPMPPFFFHCYPPFWKICKNSIKNTTTQIEPFLLTQSYFGDSTPPDNPLSPAVYAMMQDPRTGAVVFSAAE